ncbi:hypothetical protein [Salmonirosea aquatica]|uniref:Uncharacterized protein n=1 Tax=Salmonirosea aquatica TaxID=2654236 RepID=A0A7C9FZH9_9BACT|nr:hypothetical protein [Cytophagaceae bacterium SJW1-29]
MDSWSVYNGQDIEARSIRDEAGSTTVEARPGRRNYPVKMPETEETRQPERYGGGRGGGM